MNPTIEEIMSEYGCIEIVYDDDVDPDVYNPAAVKGLWEENEENEDV